MHIVIENKTVSENVRAFIAHIRKEEARRERSGGALMEKRCAVFLHRTTGMLLFADAYKEQTSFLKSEWKPLLLDFSYDPSAETFHAAVYEQVGQTFRFTDLSPLAVTTIKETMQILNHLAKRVKGPGSDLIAKIQDLCKLQIEEGSTQNERNLLTSAWHAVDRLGAERLLKGHPVGTFLFRNDYFAKLLAEQLSEQRGMDIKCIVLSVLDSNDHVSDYTLVHVDHQWRVYDNLDFCDGDGCTEIEELLAKAFKDRLKEPLYHVFIERRIA